MISARSYLFAVLAVLSAALSLGSCSQEDDLCTEGGTPQMKVKFKTTANKLMTVDTLYAQVQYADKLITIANGNPRVDSLTLPLRVDGSGFTDLYFSTRKNGPKSTVKMIYTEEAQYVSPGCGIRKLYHNLRAEITGSGPVADVQINQNDLINENKTHIYLVFKP